MTIPVPRALVLFVISLPVGFVLTALVVVAMGLPVVPHIILPWAASLALLISILSGGGGSSR